MILGLLGLPHKFFIIQVHKYSINLVTFKMLGKVVIIGNGGVGKTALVQRFLNKGFPQRYVPTLGVENVTNGQLDIWDTAGQVKHQGLREGYYIGAKKVIVVFDVTDRQSLNNVPYWLSLVKHVCDNVPILLVANKADVPDHALKIAEIEVLARNYGLEWVFASAKTGLNLDKLF